MKCPFKLLSFFSTLVIIAFYSAAGISATEAHGLLSGQERGTQANQSMAGPGSAPPTYSTVTIPGPLRSFLRMAAISQKASLDEVVPFLAHSMQTIGYTGSGRSQRPTEHLMLLERYLNQARELQALAGKEGIIRVSTCDQAKPLLEVLGYRLTQPCGPTTSVETSDARKAFLTIDSGFPLADLEDTLRGGKPFVHAYPNSQVPILFKSNDWTDIAGNRNADILDAVLHQPEVARLYWAMSHLDRNTAQSLRQSPGLEKLLRSAPVLDFYGSNISIQSGHVVVPGGIEAEHEWAGLVGASPGSPAEFISQLLEKDEGWLAAYFDALSWGNKKQQAYFTDPHRLRRFYQALRGRDISPGPARPVFRPDPGLLFLATRLQFEPNGMPLIPGEVNEWSEFFPAKGDSKVVQQWAKRARTWRTPDDVVEGMFALSRVPQGESPLDTFLALSEVDRVRSPQQRLDPQTVRLLARKYFRFKDQYTIFSEFHALDNTSITRFLNAAEAIDAIPDRSTRADAMGIFEASVGLWQIFARQGQIPVALWNNSWQRSIFPFAGVSSPEQLFDAGRNSLREILRAAAGKPDLSESEIVDLLAGPRQTTAEGERIKQDLADRMRSSLDAQRLVPLETLFALGDGLSRLSKGEGHADSLLPLATAVQSFELPKPIFTNAERIEWAEGLYRDPHVQAEMDTNLTETIKSPGRKAEMAAARGLLSPFLRDSMVALNYAYYEPPGAQMMYNNALFVRSHDFLEEEMLEGQQAWQTPRLYGRGEAAGRGAHLAGSLSDLPYVLAEVEQEFIVPRNVQALIWEDLTPDILTSAVVPRWWHVTRNELHAAALYQRFGEDLVSAAAGNEKLRETVKDIFANVMLPQKLEKVNSALVNGHPQDALASLEPGETFYLAAEFRQKFPQEANDWGKAGQDLEKLSQRFPQEVSWERLSNDFGVPHPALAQTYERELMTVKPFPTLFGYSSRLLAETWDSNNLYWARLADEKGYSPVMLNRLVPELTRRMVENIFGSHLEDREALLRALRETGEEFRQGRVASLAANASAGSGL